MPRFSVKSQEIIKELEPDLQRLFNEVIKHWDCQPIDGIRTVAEQIKNIERGVSQTMKSKHLPNEHGKSEAVDVMPYPFDWNKIQKGLDALKRADPTMQIAEVYAFIGFVRGVAVMMNIPLRQGADWNTNNQFDDHSFIDLPHHELNR